MNVQANTRYGPVTVGRYTPNAFCIRLGCRPPLIDPSTLQIRMDHPENFAAFVHEYWHYLQNLSTVAGFSTFELCHDILPIFSDTLMQTGDGRSVGSGSLCAERQQDLRDRLDILDAHEGKSQPALPGGGAAASFRVAEVVEEEHALTRNGREVPASRILLYLDIELTDGSTRDGALLFGRACVEEGVAYEVGRMVAAGGGGVAIGDNGPPFPYRVLREVAMFLCQGAELSRIELVALGTLSLLSTDPPQVFVTAVRDLCGLKGSGASSREALDKVWQGLRPHTAEVVATILGSDLPSIVRMHAGRGLIESAMEYLGDLYSTLLQRRLEQPFFDLQAFAYNRVDMEELLRLIREVLPCDTIQELEGDVDEVGRDFLVAFGTPAARWVSSGYGPSDFMRTLECQRDYLFAHLADDEIRPSGQAPAHGCPFYTICSLPKRRDDRDVCKRAPWRVYGDPEGNGACWYGNAVAATLGNVTVKRRVDGRGGGL